MTDEPLMTPPEVAAFLRISPRTLEGWRRQKRGPAHITVEGVGIRYTRAAVEAYVESKTVEP